MKIKKICAGMFTLIIIVCGTQSANSEVMSVDLKNEMQRDTGKVELSISDLEIMDLEGVDLQKIELEQPDTKIICEERANGIQTMQIGNETYYLGLDSNEKRVYSQSEIDAMWQKIDDTVEVQNVPNGISITDSVETASEYSLSNTRGNKPTTKGKILVTSDAYKNLIPTGHAAMVYSASQVVESVKAGVKWGKNNWEKNKSAVYGLIVVNGSINGSEAAATEYCRLRVNKYSYNYNYLDVWTRSRFYCSQLVWAAYYDTYGINLNTATFGEAIHPMELVNSPETILIYEYHKNGYK